MWGFVKNNFKWMLPISLVLILTLGAVGSANAAEFPKGETITAGETIDDDVFITGNHVMVDGTVKGMLFAGGTTVVLNGTVNGDALLMGDSVVVSETAVIAGNLFISGGDLTIHGQVAGSVFGGSADAHVGPTAAIARNLYYGGFSINTAEGSSIGRDVFVGGYQAVLSGDIHRDLAFGGAAVELNGLVGGNATLNVGNVDESQRASSFMLYNPYLSRYVESSINPGIRVSDAARVLGQLNYTSSRNINDSLKAVASGAVVYQTPAPPEAMTTNGEVKEFEDESIASLFFSALALGIARNFIKLMALGALTLWLFSKSFRKLADHAYQAPLKAIGWGFILMAIGFLALLIVPLVFVLMGILIGFLSLTSLLGFWFGVVGLIVLLAFVLFFFAVFTLSNILAAYLFGRWLMRGLFRQEQEKPWLNLLLGVFLYVLIRAIPIVGFLAGLTATLIGLGAFWLVFFQKKAAQ